MRLNVAGTCVPARAPEGSVKRLRIIDFGETVQGVRLDGDRRNPEPESFRVAFPGGDVDIVRTTNDEYWVHVRVNSSEDVTLLQDEARVIVGQLVDARLDIRGKHQGDTDVGDFADPGLYHLAVRIAPATNDPPAGAEEGATP